MYSNGDPIVIDWFLYSIYIVKEILIAFNRTGKNDIMRWNSKININEYTNKKKCKSTH